MNTNKTIGIRPSEDESGFMIAGYDEPMTFLECEDLLSLRYPPAPLIEAKEADRLRSEITELKERLADEERLTAANAIELKAQDEVTKEMREALDKITKIAISSLQSSVTLSSKEHERTMDMIELSEGIRSKFNMEGGA